MMHTLLRRRDAQQPRRGSVLGLMAFVLPVLLILAAISINMAYMQLTRTELSVASDAAARAASRTFSETQSVADAKTAAAATAALNTVANEALILSTDDDDNEIEFGLMTQASPTSRYLFNKVQTSAVVAGTSPASAVRVNAKRVDGNLGGRVQLPIPGILGRSHFEVFEGSTAMQVDRDIVLVVDRSGSMSWVNFSWPSGQNPWSYQVDLWHISQGNFVPGSGGWVVDGVSYVPAPGQTWTTLDQLSWENYFNNGPAPKSGWEALNEAVGVFLNVMSGTPQTEQVGLASYASTASFDKDLVSDYSLISAELGTLSPSGATAIGDGMMAGVAALIGSKARANADKTMVVMTDGWENTGSTTARAAAATIYQQHSITIHTVSYGSSVDQQLMKDVAAAGRGKHYHAPTGADLVDVFEEIANNLPTLMVD